ncbi:hypothetical protein B9Z19DRAFT_1189188 [Tuber borchii]|uniref:Uncharacterized protein n=1 Tax=Tuber borchii TaxID=42251 RepID=A0A2T7A8Q5_TUBBO|nr:hypothetical protein B9Z19DRAFT_1189188 [Tuber borchii]
MHPIVARGGRANVNSKRVIPLSSGFDSMAALALWQSIRSSSPLPDIPVSPSNRPTPPSPLQPPTNGAGPVTDGDLVPYIPRYTFFLASSTKTSKYSDNLKEGSLPTNCSEADSATPSVVTPQAEPPTPREDGIVLPRQLVQLRLPETRGSD